LQEDALAGTALVIITLWFQVPRACQWKVQHGFDYLSSVYSVRCELYYQVP